MVKQYQKHAKMLQALSHPVRLQILDILSRSPACVCDLVFQTRQRQAYISQHLMLLREAGMVRSTRLGVKNQYELAHPEAITNLLKCLLEVQQPKPSDQGATKMSNTNNNAVWHGIPRDQIDWHPAIVADRCVGCGLCVTSCGRGVYAFDYETNKPAIVAPQMCMVGCTTCATICLQDAVEFPSRGYIRQVIRQNKLLTQSKNLLKENRQKYDVVAR